MSSKRFFRSRTGSLGLSRNSLSKDQYKKPIEKPSARDEYEEEEEEEEESMEIEQKIEPKPQVKNNQSNGKFSWLISAYFVISVQSSNEFKPHWHMNFNRK